MDCKDIQKELSDFIDGCFEKKKEFQAHLEKCKDCAGEYEKMKNVVSLLKNLPEMKAPDNFTEIIIGKIKEKQEKKNYRFVLWLGRIAFAEVIALALIVLFHGFQKKEIITQPAEKQLTSQTIRQEASKKIEAVARQKKTGKQSETKQMALRNQEKPQPEIIIQLAYKPPDTMVMAEKRFFSAKEKVSADKLDSKLAEPMPADSVTNETAGKDEKSINQISVPTAVDELKTYVLHLNGKIISEQIFKDTEIVRVIVVEVPVHACNGLLENLKEKFHLINFAGIKEETLSESQIRFRLEFFR